MRGSVSVKRYIRYWVVGTLSLLVAIQCLYFVLTMFFGNNSDPVADRIDDYRELAVFSGGATVLFLAVATLLSTAAWFVITKPLQKTVRAGHPESD